MDQRRRNSGRRAQRLPRDLVVDGEWPDGILPKGEVGAAYAQAAAVRLRDAMEGFTLREFARVYSLPAMTLSMVLQGRSYPSIQTLARIEEALDSSIIPDFFERRELLKATSKVPRRIPQTYAGDR
jgi:hypothetical protein